MLFKATVLWQQGDKPTKQPLQDDNFILLFNGDLFMDRPDHSKSDTEFLFDLVKSTRTEEEFIGLFRSLTGPFSLICYSKKLGKLFFMRDSLGRNSLLIGKNSNFIFLSSVLERSQENTVLELPPLGIYSMDLQDKELSVNLYPWKRLESHEHYLGELEKFNQFLGNAVQVRDAVEPHWLVQDVGSKFNYNFKDTIEQNSSECLDIMDYLLKDPEISSACDQFLELLENSVRERVLNTPKLCRTCIHHRESTTSCTHPKIGILFSGGIDCSILTVLASKFIDPSLPIDLLNVAFEKVQRDPKKISEINWNVPDRITGKETLDELRKICPERTWNFVEINVDRKELDQKLKERIVHLVYPLETILDESLGGAIWFAARGSGFIEGVLYQSTSRVLLIGSGADELNGGYTRHRNAFKRGGVDLLAQELELDWVRLPSRNLARDDRIVGDHGITGRSPYVQENLTKFLQKLTPLQKCYHQLEPGIGDKLLLRLCGYRLGLKNCSQFKKRALQFGSRIADRKQNAKDFSGYLQCDS
jgi:asparagine synthetase B (glutamine-hydrolysing)